MATGDGGVAADGGADANDPWGCLNETPTPSGTTPIDVQFVLYDAISAVVYGGSVDGGTDLNILDYVPQPGVSVAACGPLDPTCASPAAGPASTDDAGLATLSVPGAFTGFYSLQRADSVPELFYPGARLLAAEPSVHFPSSMTSNESFAELQSALGIPANTDTDAGPGVVSVTQFDCNDRHVSGATFVSSPAAQQTIYLQNNFPSRSATQTAPEGSGVLVNVPSGSVGITSILATQSNRPLGTANVVVRPGSITLVYMRPRTR